MICVCAGTRRAARLLTQLYEAALRPASLTAAQFELLATLRQRPGISQSALANFLALDQTTLSRNIKHLESRRLVKRSLSASDRRQTTYILTSIGDETLTRAMPLWQSAHGEMQRLLADQWHPTLATLMQLTAITPHGGPG